MKNSSAMSAYVYNSIFTASDSVVLVTVTSIWIYPHPHTHQMCAQTKPFQISGLFFLSFFSVALYVIPPIHVDYVKYIQFRLNKNKRTKKETLKNMVDS